MLLLALLILCLYGVVTQVFSYSHPYTSGTIHSGSKPIRGVERTYQCDFSQGYGAFCAASPIALLGDCQDTPLLGRAKGIRCRHGWRFSRDSTGDSLSRGVFPFGGFHRQENKGGTRSGCCFRPYQCHLPAGTCRDPWGAIRLYRKPCCNPNGRLL